MIAQSPGSHWRKIALLCACLLALLAQPAMAERAAHIRASLAAETSQPAPGSTVRVAIHMTPEEGWHGYWINPGESGLPISVRWDSPAGVKFSELRHPAPSLLQIQGIASYVHDGPFTLLAEMAVPAGLEAGSPLPLKAHLSWLACSDSLCVPERATLSMALRIGNDTPDPEGAELVRKAEARLPSPLQGATVTADGRDWVFAIPASERLSDTEARLYPAGDGWFAPDARQTVSRGPDGLLVRVAMRGDAPGKDFSGVLSDGENAFAITAAESQAVPGGNKARQVTVEEQGQPADSESIPVMQQTPGPSVVGRAPSAGAGAPPPRSGGALLATSFLGAVLGGLLLNLMPCVFPILSLKVLNLARSGGHRSNARHEAIGYASGSIAVAAALGAILIALKAAGQEVGWSFQLQSPIVILLLLILTSAIALNLAGLFEVRLPAPARLPGRRDGWIGGFSAGSLAALIATPCSGPFMAGALGAALILPPAAAFLVFAGLGLGMALPFIAIAWVPALQMRMPKPGQWMDKLRRALSLPMFATALALAWVLGRQAGVNGMTIGIAVTLLLGVGLWRLGRRQAKGRTGWAALAPASLALGLVLVLGIRVEETALSKSSGRALHEPFSESRLAELRSEGTPVFVDFTADWCLTCKVNEKIAIETATVQHAFAEAGVVTLTGDWTLGDPAITRFLARHDRNSIPFYLYFPAGEDGQVLPQLLTPDLLADLARGT